MLETTKKDVTVFSCEQLGELRTHQSESGKIWFCLADVANALCLEQVSRLKSRLKADGVTTIKGVSLTTNQHGATTEQVVDLNFIDEPNLYRCIFQSRKEEAEKFQNWVFEEVLPSIRKSGGYIATTNTMTDTEIMAKAILLANNTIEQRNARIKELEDTNEKQTSTIARLQPKAEFADAAFKAEGKVDIGQAAKILGLPFGRNTLFKKLKEKGVFFGSRNEPKQRYIDAGYFELSQLPPIKRDHHPDLIVMKCTCTQKGLAYINHLFGGNPTQPSLTVIK